MAQLNLRYPRHVEPVARAEAEAKRMMEAAGTNAFVLTTDEDWVEAFGSTKSELEELRSDLAKRYESIPFWRRREREAVIQSYINVSSMLMVAVGLRSLWR